MSQFVRLMRSYERLIRRYASVAASRAVLRATLFAAGPGEAERRRIGLQDRRLAEQEELLEEQLKEAGRR